MKMQPNKALIENENKRHAKPRTTFENTMKLYNSIVFRCHRFALGTLGQ